MNEICFTCDRWVVPSPIVVTTTAGGVAGVVGSNVVVGIIGYLNGTDSLRDAAYDRLIEVRDSRAREVTGLFDSVENSLLLASHDSAVVDAEQAFAASVAELATASIASDAVAAADPTTDQAATPGVLTPEQARYHPYSNVITRCVGAGSEVVPDTYEGEIKPGDLFLVASDGLTGMVDDRRLQQLLMARSSPGRIVDALISEANGRGGLDNITAIVIQVQQVDAARATTPTSAPAARAS